MGGLAFGERRTEHFEVRTEHLATAWDNDLPVLATPIVVWWTELVAMRLMQRMLGPGEMTVGAGHDRVRHLAPTGLGRRVAVHAECLKVTPGRAVFEVSAGDAAGTVYEGIHSRAVVARERMLAALKERSSA